MKVEIINGMATPVNPYEATYKSNSLTGGRDFINPLYSDFQKLNPARPVYCEDEKQSVKDGIYYLDTVWQYSVFQDFSDSCFFNEYDADPEKEFDTVYKREVFIMPAKLKNLGKNNGIENCPFCGEPEGENVMIGYKYPRYMITCIPCNVTMAHDRKDKVIGMWNNRKISSVYKLINS